MNCAYNLACWVDIWIYVLHGSSMLLRIGIGGGLLVVVLSSWATRSGTDAVDARALVMLERRGMANREDIGEEFSLGLVRTRALLDMLPFETRRYEVPPFFASLGDEGGAAIADDPIVEGYEPEAPYSRSSAREILRARGIEFEDGASASFNHDSATLVVTNRPAQLDLVEQLVASLQREGIPGQIEVEGKTVEITQANLEEWGFDWVLDAFELEAERNGDGS